MFKLAVLSLLLVGCTTVPDEPIADRPGGGKADGSRRIILDCNTSLGPDQQVTVLDDGSTLTLRELTTSGAQVDRELSRDEWDGQILTLRDDGWGSKSTLSKSMGDWVLESKGGGVNEFGFADCWVDESQ